MYDEGARYSCAFFAVFCLKVTAPHDEAQEIAALAAGPKVGFTVTRAIGKSVTRNRLRRRLREAVRLHLAELPSGWWVVFNPRRPGLEAPLPELEREVHRIFQRCARL